MSFRSRSTTPAASLVPSARPGRPLQTLETAPRPDAIESEAPEPRQWCARLREWHTVRERKGGEREKVTQRPTFSASGFQAGSEGHKVLLIEGQAAALELVLKEGVRRGS
jgi:hypothetical protein